MDKFINDELTLEEYHETSLLLEEQANSFRYLDFHKDINYHKLNIGGAMLMVKNMPGTYDLCICESGFKFKWCCKQYN